MASSAPDGITTASGNASGNSLAGAAGDVLRGSGRCKSRGGIAPDGESSGSDASFPFPLGLSDRTGDVTMLDAAEAAPSASIPPLKMVIRPLRDVGPVRYGIIGMSKGPCLLEANKVLDGLETAWKELRVEGIADTVRAVPRELLSGENSPGI
jgi:hypothetical protein